MTPRRLEGRVTVVTGAARGIGLAIAQAARRSGSRVVNLDLAPPDSSADTAGMEWRMLDVTDVEGVSKVFREVAVQLGPVDVLVNNAGVLCPGSFEDVSPADWQKVMHVNLEAMFFVTQSALPHLSSSAAIVNIASTSAFVAGRDQTAYEVSKAGVVMLTRSLAVELGARGLRVNAVAPGLIDTPMTRTLFGDDERFDRRVREKVPLGRAGRPEDIGDAVVFLASAEAAYMTGETLVVDGGWLLP